MTTKVTEKCDICGKECRSVKQHKAVSHPGVFTTDIIGINGKPVPVTAYRTAVEKIDISTQEGIDKVVIADLKAKITELEKVKQEEEIPRELEKGNKSIEDIAKILHESITKPLGAEHGFTVQEWGEFDPAEYINVARKIKG